MEAPPRHVARCRIFCLRLILAFCAAGLVVLTLEFGLRAVGFSAPLQPIVIAGQDGEVKADSGGFASDPELHYRFEPGGFFRGRPVNRHGYLGREVEDPTATNMVRVLCAGDSCTAQGSPPYSDRLHTLLQNDPPSAAPWEAFNMAVHGYSTEHGLRLFRRDGRHFAPDYVTVYYGWNDHWRSSDTDRMRMPRAVSPMKAAIVRQLHRSRLYQFAVSRAVAQPERDHHDFVLRVPHGEYRANLLALIEEIRAAGAEPILITAPRSSKLTSLLVRNRQVATIEDATRLHDEYCEITRAVAAETGAPLLDLEKELHDEKAYHLFSGDGIHLKEEGMERIAEEIHSLLKNLAAERKDA